MFIYIDSTTGAVLGAAEKDVLNFPGATIIERSVVPPDIMQRKYDFTTGDLVLDADKMLEEAKTLRVEYLRSMYEQEITSNVAYMNTEFQADEYSQDLITKTLTAAGGTLPADFFWLDAFNNPVPMTYADLQGLAATILQRGQAAFAKYQDLKAQVLAATTLEAVEAIFW